MPDAVQLSIAATVGVGASALLYLCGACGGGAGAESKWNVVRAAVLGGGRKNAKTQAARRAELGMVPAQFSAFMSHAKAEAAMEAAMAQSAVSSR